MQAPTDPFFHAGSRILQDQADSRRIADRIAELRRHASFSDADIELITNVSFFFLATADAKGRPDCSVKGGAPGFVRIIAADQLSFPDYDGNGMFRSLGNVTVNPAVGLLFIDFADGRKLRVNGRAELRRVPAGLEVVVTAQDIFPNCPRYLPRLVEAESSVFNPRPGYRPPPPPWKAKPDLKDYLPRASGDDAARSAANDVQPEPVG